MMGAPTPGVGNVVAHHMGKHAFFPHPGRYLIAFRLSSLSKPWFMLFEGQLQGVSLVARVALPTGVMTPHCML